MDFSKPESRAYGAVSASASIRVRNDDFQVDEVLRFAPEGDGPHVWLQIEKSGLNTMDVAKALARHVGVRGADVGFAGQKDRHAVTRQWFSVNLGNRAEPDWHAAGNERFKVVSAIRHGKKLRRGQLLGNRFSLTLRNIVGNQAELESRLGQIAGGGVPNYFGPQRFGYDGRNLRACIDMFASGKRARDRYRRSMYLSAGRSWLFNRVLSQRVREGTWNRALVGDILMFDDSRSRFAAEDKNECNDPRLGTLDLHPTGPLWGKGSPETAFGPGALERAVALEYSQLSEGLETAGLESDRRPLRLSVKDLSHTFDADEALHIEFVLRAGAFATTVLGELVDWNDTGKVGGAEG